MAPSPARRRFALLAGLAGIATLVACGGVLVWLAVRPPPVMPEEYENMIGVSLPVGTPRSEVEAWLTAQNIPHESKVDEEGRKRVRGVVDLTRRFLSYPGGIISLDFYFDEDDRLIDHNIGSSLYTW
jgi:hypothetical protein